MKNLKLKTSLLLAALALVALHGIGQTTNPPSLWGQTNLVNTNHPASWGQTNRINTNLPAGWSSGLGLTTNHPGGFGLSTNVYTNAPAAWGQTNLVNTNVPAGLTNQPTANTNAPQGGLGYTPNQNTNSPTPFIPGGNDFGGTIPGGSAYIFGNTNLPAGMVITNGNQVWVGTNNAGIGEPTFTNWLSIDFSNQVAAIVTAMGGGGGGNPFDQSLNSYDSPSFSSLTITGGLSHDGSSFGSSGQAIVSDGMGGWLWSYDWAISPFDQSLNSSNSPSFAGLTVTGALNFDNNSITSDSGTVIANGFKVSGGSSSEFLKADGSKDSTAYSTFSGNYSDLSGAPDLSSYLTSPNITITDIYTPAGSSLTLHAQSGSPAYVATPVCTVNNSGFNYLDDGYGNATFALSVSVSGGTSSEFLKADGSRDSSSYITSVVTDGTTITGDGTSGNPLVSTAGSQTPWMAAVDANGNTLYDSTYTLQINQNRGFRTAYGINIQADDSASDFDGGSITLYGGKGAYPSDVAPFISIGGGSDSHAPNITINAAVNGDNSSELGTITLAGALFDGSTIGTSGQVLTATGAGWSWQDGGGGSFAIAAATDFSTYFDVSGYALNAEYATNAGQADYSTQAYSDSNGRELATLLAPVADTGGNGGTTIPIKASDTGATMYLHVDSSGVVTATSSP